VSASLVVGQALPGFTAQVSRADLVRYAGASGDFNPIHWSESAAAALGLPTVIAHGMLTMGLALRVVTDVIGDPGAVVGYYVRFTKPVPVPEEGTAVRFSGVVTEIADGIATIAIEASLGDQAVLGAAVAEVRVG
jgi:acyl dehydratase